MLASFLASGVIALTAASTLAAASNTTFYTHSNCDVGVHHASEHLNKTVKALHEQDSRRAHSSTHKAKIQQRASTQITVPTYFHIVTKASEAGSITKAMASAQAAAMNKAYSRYGITFNLIDTTITANDAWAVGAGSDMATMKAALRQGTYDTLNIYFQTDLTGGMLGTCTLPSDIGPGTPNPSTYVSDGCNVQANTMPGGNIPEYNSGGTGIHETGHWLGLLHTFEGYACTGTGDYINDTPLQSTSTDGCPTSPPKDSCPGVAGYDAIHNYMDYSTDACYTSFTGNQVTRMQDMWAQYRNGR